MLLSCKWKWLTTSCKCASNEMFWWIPDLRTISEIEKLLLKLWFTGSRSTEPSREIEIASQSQQVFNLVKWRCVVQNRHPAVQSPNTQAYLYLRCSQRTSLGEKLTMWVCICVCRQERIRGLKQLFSRRTSCLLSAPWHSKRSFLSLSPSTVSVSQTTRVTCANPKTQFH